MVGVLAQQPGRKGRLEAVRWLNQLVAQRTTEEGDPGDLGLILALTSLVEVAEVAEWETEKTAQLEKHVVTVWVQELLDAVRKQRETRAARFQKLAGDIAYLRVAGKEDVVTRLIQALRDPDDNIRKIAAETLKTLATWSPVKRLLPLLEDPDSDVRQAVVQALGAHAEQVLLERLLPLLEDPSGNVREAVVQVLGAHAEQVPRERLLPLLEDPDEDVRQAVVEVLKAQNTRLPLTLLQPFCYHKDEDVRRVAVEVLETFHETLPSALLLDLLGDEESSIRQIALGIMKKQTPQILSDIAAQALVVLDGDVFTALTQMYVADTIGELGIVSAVLLEKLSELLDWPHWQVRVKAAQALGQLRRNIPDAAIRRLLMLRRDPDPRMHAVRESADDALAEILSLETGIEDE